MILFLLAVAAFFLAWSNGANDNFKGVATLYGSGTAGYGAALGWASLTTLAGSLVSVHLARSLLKTFSGAGLLPQSLLGPALLVAVGLAAAATILLATRLGMPTSTTHALTGGLVGAGLVADAGGIDWHRLATSFAQPLLLSPILAIAAAAILYPLLRRLRRRLGITRSTCLCVGNEEPRPITLLPDGSATLASVGGSAMTISVEERARCVERYQGSFLGVDAQRIVDALHYTSAGAVCFARAVNDTPKIAALLLAGSATIGGMAAGGGTGLVVLALAMTAGGLVQARGVAETMSNRITDLDPGQGLTANLVTAGLVLAASRVGVPVSTTHVSCGSIFGIGAVTRTVRWRTIAQILMTWVTTLPLGLLLGAVLYAALLHVGV